MGSVMAGLVASPAMRVIRGPGEEVESELAASLGPIVV